MKLILALAFVLTPMFATAQGKQMLNYSDECVAAAETVSKNPDVDKHHAENLMSDLEGLHLQTSIILDKNDDVDFRLQVFNIAETTRQMLNKGLNEISKVSSTLSELIVNSCELKGLDTPVQFYFEVTYLSLLMGISEEEVLELSK